MKWLEVRIDTCHAGLEAVETFLSVQGIDDVVIDDSEEFRALAQDDAARWGGADEAPAAQKAGDARVSFYLEDSEAGWAKLAAVRMALTLFRAEAQGSCGSLLMTLEHLEDADWQDNWKQYYKPMEIGKRLLVVPKWEQAEAPGRIPLILDPGLAFGTGSHATTRLCLTALEACIRGGERVADLGCGSGILAIAALKLGAKSAFACDIDDKCGNIVRENAQLNGVDESSYTVRCGDVLTDAALKRELGGGYDVVLANIVADVILALAPAVRPLLVPGGTFICSGIIDDRAVETADGLRLAGFSILQSREQDGWFCYVCR